MNAAPSPGEIAATLTPAMRRALWQRGRDLVEPERETVTAAGMTMRGLRQRKIVAGPLGIVTERGRAIIAAAALDARDGDA